MTTKIMLIIIIIILIKFLYINILVEQLNGHPII